MRPTGQLRVAVRRSSRERRGLLREGAVKGRRLVCSLFFWHHLCVVLAAAAASLCGLSLASLHFGC